MQQSGQATDFLHRSIAEDMIDRLDFMRFVPEKALITGDLSALLVENLHSKGTETILADPDSFDESEPWPFGPVNFIASILSLDTVNDLPGALIHIRHALRPGGIAMISFTAAGSLPVLRQSMFVADAERPAARLHPMVDNRAGAELMQRAGFARQVVDSYTIPVRYSSLERLVQDLREQGLSNVLASTAPQLTRASVARAREAFLSHADDQDRITEKFEIINLTGWKT
ncbi:MAG: methyltransferase domain-containing protein [Sphingomonadaceae bacterium]